MRIVRKLYMVVSACVLLFASVESGSADTEASVPHPMFFLRFPEVSEPSRPNLIAPLKFPRMLLDGLLPDENGYSDDRRDREAGRLLRTVPGEVFRDCVECPELVVVSAGSFTMGAPASEEGRSDDEGPQHRVSIDEAFAVGIYEVTHAEFASFAAAAWYETGDGCRVWDGEWRNLPGRGWRDPGFRQTERDPVVCVSWEDAQAYVRWLSWRTGEEYRLLSESEWEYVARGGTSTARHWGETETGQCRYANGADIVSCDDGHYRTAPVGSYAGNAYGLYDVLGNVWEWTQDCWSGSYAGAGGDGQAWESGECGRRVARGGSWNAVPTNLRSANRLGLTTGTPRSYLGFRVARTLRP